MYRDVFVRMFHVYTRVYPECSFRFLFDGAEPIDAGDSERRISVEIRDTDRVLRRIFHEGSIGLGESYCEGNIRVADMEYRDFLVAFIRIPSDRRILRALPLLDRLRVWWGNYSSRYFTKGTQSADINSHYSLSDWFANAEDSNAFYLEWLDAPYIQYSCGKWDPDTKTVEESEVNKLAFYAERLGIRGDAARGKTLLDLGCGWGGLMFYMAEHHGVSCTGLTLSTAQAAYIR